MVISKLFFLLRTLSYITLVVGRRRGGYSMHFSKTFKKFHSAQICKCFEKNSNNKLQFAISGDVFSVYAITKIILHFLFITYILEYDEKKIKLMIIGQGSQIVFFWFGVSTSEEKCHLFLKIHVGTDMSLTPLYFRKYNIIICTKNTTGTLKMIQW